MILRDHPTDTHLSLAHMGIGDRRLSAVASSIGSLPNLHLYNLKFVVFGVLGTDPTECDVVLHLDDKVSGEHSFIQYHEDTACFYYVDVLICIIKINR